ncbi:hypothetical protein [Desulfallas thermosapovorans]|uniref:hypothetical protein n=1 Tax=Desulfallas thermosapovorans TaxID=58137 RepID=UPI0014120390|nr:hypothetical protein [Desulfallas thermosapovorans]
MRPFKILLSFFIIALMLNFLFLAEWARGSPNYQNEPDELQNPEPVMNSPVPAYVGESHESAGEAHMAEPVEVLPEPVHDVDQSEFYIPLEAENNQIHNLSFPITIQVAGYNSKSNYLYINYTLMTTKAVLSSERAIFNYVVQVFNAHDVLIGNIGSFESPEQVVGMWGQNSIDIRNSGIKITTKNLPATYRIIITVIETIII